MKNFGFTRLVLINPCKLGEEAKGRASHAQDVLKAAEVCTIDEVFDRSNIVIATTGTVSKSVCHAMRMPFYSPKELRERLKDVDGRISIFFGRENWGLNNEEVKRSDMICTIPTSEVYPILNLSHAVGVVCYEPADLPLPAITLASRTDMESLYSHVERYFNVIHHPDFKRENTMILLRGFSAGATSPPARRAPSMGSCAGASGISTRHSSTGTGPGREPGGFRGR